MKELAHAIENQWMTYNASVISRLHPDVERQRLASLLINNTPDIIAALKAYEPATDVVITPAVKMYGPPTDVVITGDEGEPPRKTRKKGD